MQENSKHTCIRKQCESFLNKITLNNLEQQELEKETRLQRLSSKWKEERRFRVTLSWFARICKVRDASSYKNIIKNITDNREICTPAISYGIITNSLLSVNIQKLLDLHAKLRIYLYICTIR